MRNISDKFAEKIKPRISCSVTFFFLPNIAIYEIWQAIHGRKAHAHCMLDT